MLQWTDTHDSKNGLNEEGKNGFLRHMYIWNNAYNLNNV